MTDHQIHEAIFRQKPKKEDQRPWWMRLLGSIRPEVRPAKKPYIGIKGKVEF